MKRRLLSLAFFGFGITLNAQTWTKLFDTPDSMYAQSVTYFNMGDTLTFHGGLSSNIFSKNSFISTNGGQNFSYDNTQLDVTIKPSMFSSLRFNKKLIGYQNAPNIGSYLFNGTGNWSTLLTNAEGTGTFFETGLNQTFVQIENYISPIDFSNPVFNPTFTLTETFDIVSYLNVGTRTIFGLANGEIKYVENGNFNAIQTATVNNSSVATNKFVYRIWKAGANLFAVINADYQQLFKSTDNGTTWDLVTTARSDSQFEPNLLSTFINGTSDGRIYFINKTSPDDKLYISNDGGLNAVAIALPSEINTNTYDLNKILVNGNKVWMDVKAFDESDFISTNSAVAGLYSLEGGASNLTELEKNVTFYPNPFSEKLQLNSEIETNLSIITIDGKKVYEITFMNDLEIETTKFSNGSYLLKLETEKGTLTQKIIKY